MFHDFATFLRPCIFFLLPFSDLFSSALLFWLFPPLLFHPSILSEVWLLNFLRLYWTVYPLYIYIYTHIYHLSTNHPSEQPIGLALFGRLLLENLSLEVSFGERLLVVLPASGGKSLPLDAINVNNLPGICWMADLTRGLNIWCSQGCSWCSWEHVGCLTRWLTTCSTFCLIPLGSMLGSCGRLPGYGATCLAVQTSARSFVYFPQMWNIGPQGLGDTIDYGHSAAKVSYQIVIPKSDRCEVFAPSMFLLFAAAILFEYQLASPLSSTPYLCPHALILWFHCPFPQLSRMRAGLDKASKRATMLFSFRALNFLPWVCDSCFATHSRQKEPSLSPIQHLSKRCI